jgi:DNA polymerase
LRYYQVKKEVTRRGLNWSCYGRLKNGAGYGRVKIYGGALTGHIVQASARDVIAEAMVKLDARGHALILTVHDELVSLDGDNFAEFEEAMQTPPAWLTDFPLAVDVFQTERYRK